MFKKLRYYLKERKIEKRIKKYLAERYELEGINREFEEEQKHRTYTLEGIERYKKLESKYIIQLMKKVNALKDLFYELGCWGKTEITYYSIIISYDDKRNITTVSIIEEPGKFTYRDTLLI